MSEINITAVKREDFKGSATVNFRKKGMIPGIFYGHAAGSIPIAVNELALRPLIYTSESHVVNLNIEGVNEKFNAIIKDVQFHPLSDKPIHFDFQSLSEDKEVHIEVPVHLKGNAIGVRNGGVLQHVYHKLEVICLPKHIPAHIELDIANLEIGDSIKVGDLKLEGVKFVNDGSASIVAVAHPTKMADAAEGAVATEVAAGEAPKEPEVVAKGKKEEK
jgi:large subunit ribosomal protein L25